MYSCGWWQVLAEQLSVLLPEGLGEAKQRVCSVECNQPQPTPQHNSRRQLHRSAASGWLALRQARLRAGQAAGSGRRPSAARTSAHSVSYVPFRSFIYRSIKPQWDRIREKRAEIIKSCIRGGTCTSFSASPALKMGPKRAPAPISAGNLKS